MIAYYKKSIIRLLNKIHDIRNNPFENQLDWKNIQEEIIKKIFYFEKVIIKNKDEIKKINIKRKSPIQRLSKEESIIEKEKIKNLDYQINEYRWLIKIYKEIGDAIAFTFWHKLDIKPQVFKQSPGFLSGKVGFKQEKKIFNYAYKKGIIAILHDITSVLRYADISLATKEGVIPIEVKTSNNKNERVIRQNENANKVFDYLEKDKVEGLYNLGTMYRMEISSPELNFIIPLNELIEQSKMTGYATKIVEKGVLYGVFHNEGGLELLNQIPFKQPQLTILNNYKFAENGYYPFSLSITNGENYINFIEGAFIIAIIIDMDIVFEVANEYGYSVEPSKQDGFIFNFKNVNSSENIKEFSISFHYLYRGFFEFISFKWLLEDAFKKPFDSNLLEK
ncbi:hypothetical protein [Dysgonomonas capnocytophagoides]|uniref:hypothetical protein n=1 Tax=Dysgonomonas capnocytophagoides TaxID=45254 RepID=UPI000428D407|nr:hypothetical protein [Dysgonomonas capnocytophagoides]